jgi:uncharacterized protein YndB with AHSA1/START domain
MTEPLVVKVRTTATPAQTLDALTNQDAVATWLAEHAVIDLPDRFEFWGPSIPEGDAAHQTLVAVDDTSLRFTWLLDGEKTSTEIAVSAADDGTVVTLTQSHFDFNDAITGASIRGVLQTFWALALANLVDHLEGRPLTPRADFTSSELRATVTIDAPVTDVFDSLVASDKVSAWFGYPIEIEPHVGGRFAMGGLENNPDPALIVDLVPNERLSINFGPGGIGTWELADTDGATRLTVISSGFDATNPPYAGWLGILSGVAELRRFHELVDWRSITIAA